MGGQELSLFNDIKTVVAQIENEIETRKGNPPIPESLVFAIVAAEDRRFFRHCGIDLMGVARALRDYALWGSVSGASTVEQQLVRTLRGRYELTISRKLSEMCIAIVISRRFHKKAIIEVYSRIAYLGWHARGVGQAAKRLGIDLSPSISKREAATIAAMLKAPMPKYPSENYAKRLQHRIEYILRYTQKTGGAE